MERCVCMVCVCMVCVRARFGLCVWRPFLLIRKDGNSLSVGDFGATGPNWGGGLHLGKLTIFISKTLIMLRLDTSFDLYYYSITPHALCLSRPRNICTLNYRVEKSLFLFSYLSLCLLITFQ